MKRFLICYLSLAACNYAPMTGMDVAAQNQPAPVQKKGKIRRFSPRGYRENLEKKIAAAQQKPDNHERNLELLTLHRRLYHACAQHPEKRAKIQLILHALGKQLPQEQAAQVAEPPQDQPAQPAGWLSSIFSWWGNKK